MARPIRETPILTGTDAENFIAAMQEVENLDESVRQANKEKLRQDFIEALKKITLCL